MVEREVVALVTRDRNPPATPVSIRPSTGSVAQLVERLVEAQGAQGQYLPDPPIMLTPHHELGELQILGHHYFTLVAKLDKASGFEPEDVGVRVPPRVPITPSRDPAATSIAGRVLVLSMGSYPIANGRSIRPPATISGTVA